jgi:hypothetical protein
MLSDSRSQRATLTADDKSFVLLLNPSSSAYGFQGSKCLIDTALKVAVFLACSLSAG